MSQICFSMYACMHLSIGMGSKIELEWNVEKNNLQNENIGGGGGGGGGALV